MGSHLLTLVIVLDVMWPRDRLDRPPDNRYQGDDEADQDESLSPRRQVVDDPVEDERNAQRHEDREIRGIGEVDRGGRVELIVLDLGEDLVRIGLADRTPAGG